MVFWFWVYNCWGTLQENKCLLILIFCMQSFGSQEWDTGFAIQALLASNLASNLRFAFQFFYHLLTLIIKHTFWPLFFYLNIYTHTHIYPVFTQSNYCNFHEKLKRSKTILLGTSKACTVTFPKDRGPSLIKIMDGKFLIALQKVWR